MATGLWDEERWAAAAMITPVTAGGGIDHGRLASLGKRLLEHGLNGLVVFGTTGEGASFPAGERLEAVEAMIGAGIDPGRLCLGLASSAPAEMAWLARRAGDLGLAATLATPPFFFRDVDQEGVYRAYAMMLEAAGPEAPPLMLYHIPQVAGVRLEVRTVARLVERFPEKVRGIKDSEPSTAYMRSLLETMGRRMTVVLGVESMLPEGLALGARGTVCGMGNLIPAAIARLVRGEPGGIEPVLALEQAYGAFAGVTGIPATKAAVADRLGDDAYRACVPPLLPVSAADAAPLVRCSTL
jgi:4-hydroxy-tetrahydrodipicolinate synthase